MSVDLLEQLRAGGFSCVIRNKGHVYTFSQRGVADLYDLYTCRPEILRGADVADKVVGRGAAALMALGGVRSLHAGVVSSPALALLRDAGVEVACEQEVPYIINRAGTGRCPLETATEGLAGAEAMWPAIQAFVASLREGGAPAGTTAQHDK